EKEGRSNLRDAGAGSGIRTGRAIYGRSRNGRTMSLLGEKLELGIARMDIVREPDKPLGVRFARFEGSIRQDRFVADPGHGLSLGVDQMEFDGRFGFGLFYGRSEGNRLSR